MIVILLLIPLSIIIAVGFFVAFIWAVRSGQYEDTCTPAMRLLLEEQRTKKAEPVELVSNAAAPTPNQQGTKDD